MTERSHPELVKENEVLEPARAIARDLIADVGRSPALGYLAGRLLGAGGWRRARQVLRLMAAV